MTTLPSFTDTGALPAGDYDLSFGELRESFLVTGPAPERPNWDVLWRWELVDRLEVLVRQLWQVEIDEVYVGGSFVKDVGCPIDIDGYFVCDVSKVASGELERELNLLDPFKIWTWSPSARRAHRHYPKKQLPMWHQYRVDLYPHYREWSWISDDHGYPLELPAAMRCSRYGRTPHGVIRIKRSP